MVVAVMIGLTSFPQLLAWHSIYGRWIAVPYLADHDPAFNWSHPHVLGVLASSFHGLFSWHPVYLLALIGLIVLGRRDARLALGLLTVLALEVYVVAAWWCWWQGDSFGGRMFVDGVWVWVFGLTALLQWSRSRGLWRTALAVGVVLIVWNGLALFQYRLGFVPMGEPLTWRQMTVDRITLPVELLRRFGS
jgi:uncharacterized protein YjeT (DUF2065 family)